MKKRKFIRTGSFYVYIVQCQDGTYYTGYTNDIARRLKQHITGKGGARYTRWKKAGVLVWSREYKRFRPAWEMEKRIKTLTRQEKEALVGGRSLTSIFKTAGK